MGFKFVNVSEALAQFDSLLRRDRPVNGSLDFRDRCFAAWVDKRRDIKGFAWMFQDIVGNGTCRFSKDITENIIKFQVGNSQAANSLSPLEKEEKRACLYSVRPFGSVIPIQA